MKIKINFSETVKIKGRNCVINWSNEGYYNSIDEAIIALQKLKNKKVIQPRCDKCVHWEAYCGHTDKDGKCPDYKRDPPDGGYYG